MFSLVITIIAIALVAVLAVAALYYGGSALKEAGATARATTLITQSTQVLGAAELQFAEHRQWSSSTDQFVELRYLKTVPMYKGQAGATRWAQPMPGVPTYWVLKSTDADACRLVNLKARGDNGIYNKARPGLVTQCFGSAEPFTTVTTRRGLSDTGSGLDVVFDFYNERNPGAGVGFAPDGGGWALEPTAKPGTGGGTAPSTDNGAPDGTYLGGDLSASLPGQGGIGANVVNVGSVGSNGTVTQEVLFTNTGKNPLPLGGTTVTGDFHQVGSSCTGTLAPGQSCSVTVQAGPFPGLTEEKVLSGSVVLNTGKGAVEVGLSGKVQPSAPGPVQIGVTTNDPGDTALELVFPDTEVGQSSYKWVRVQNVGSSMTYAGTPLTALPPFSVVETDCGGQQAYGAYCWARLAFSPTAATLYAGAEHPLTLHANGQAVTVGLSGRGTPKPVAGVSVLPQALDWGMQAALGQYEQSLTVRNNGQTPLTFTRPPAIVEGTEGFMVSSNLCPATLSIGASCQVKVRFMPDLAKAFTGSVEMTFAEAEAGGQSVVLSGTGTNPLRAKSADLVLPAARAGQLYAGAPDLATGWELVTGSALDNSQMTFTVKADSALPDGLLIDAATRKLQGTPTTSGSYAFTLEGRYQNKFFAEKYFTLMVGNKTLTVKDIQGGTNHFCALTTENGVKCWGVNSAGQLGNGTTTNSSVPMDVQGLTAGVAKLFVGANANCALTQDGRVLCWGQNTNGELGMADTSAQLVPALSSAYQGASSVTFGDSHSCAVMAGGDVRCVGSGVNWRLGNASTVSSLTPVQPTGLASGIAKISSGGSYTCALANNGEVRCWGVGPSVAQTPTIIAGLGSGSGAIDVSVGGGHACALLNPGVMKCWGSQLYGSLGNGSTSSSGTSTPQAVATLTSVSQMSISSGYTTCAVQGTSLWCWGSGEFAKSFTGSTANESRPKLATTFVLPEQGSVAKVATGGSASCAMLSSGAVKCVGRNAYGQLGNGTKVDSTTTVPVQ